MVERRWWVVATGALLRIWLGALVLLVGVRLAGIERGTFLILAIGALPISLLPAYPMLVAFAVRRRWWSSAGVAAAVVASHLALIAPSLTAAERATGGTALRVVTANLYVLNTDNEAAGQVLRDLRPDVLVVTELDAEGLAGLRASGLLDDLPYSVASFDLRSETVGLFSRLPLRDTAVRRIGGRALPRATVTVGATEVRLFGHHSLPPVQGLERLWREALSDLATEVGAVDIPVVVAGDLNADRDHAPFRRLLDAGLRDAHDERGRGLARTWPERLPLLHLDHVLVSGGIGVADIREERIPGSDHLAVVADLLVQARS